MINRLKILGIDYEIKTGGTGSVGESKAVGEHHPTACTIWIDTSINSFGHQKSVLLHEIIEALDYRLELKLDHERITQLEAGLFQTLMDNPHLLDFLKTEEVNATPE